MQLYYYSFYFGMRDLSLGNRGTYNLWDFFWYGGGHFPYFFLSTKTNKHWLNSACSGAIHRRNAVFRLCHLQILDTNVPYISYRNRATTFIRDIKYSFGRKCDTFLLFFQKMTTRNFAFSFPSISSDTRNCHLPFAKAEVFSQTYAPNFLISLYIIPELFLLLHPI